MVECLERSLWWSLAAVLAVFLVGVPASAQEVTRYVRYEHEGLVSYGTLEGGMVRRLAGDLFDDPQPTDELIAVDRVRLLAPVRPSKVIAVGLNYRSHLGDREPAAYPGLFAKYPTSVVGPGAAIEMPPDATDLHYEGELVIVIGREARDVSVEDAPAYVFGVTAGNDVSERAWQRQDLQWLRAKASDTFGPIGPVIATGLDYGDLLLQSRVNGEVKQQERTSQMEHGVAALVSWASRHVALEPGDLIYTGTPGKTTPLAPGDVVEIELEKVGVLRNPVKEE